MVNKSTERTNIKGFLIWYCKHPIIAVTPFIICLLAALAYINLSPKKYLQTTALSLKFNTNGTAMTKEFILFNDISFIKRQMKFENDKEFLGSMSLAKELVKTTNMQNEVYEDKGLTSKLLYTNSPISFTLNADETCHTFCADAFPSKNSILLRNITVNGEEIPKEIEVTYGLPKETGFGTISIEKTNAKQEIDKLILKYRDSKIAAKEISKNLKFHTATMFATVLNFNYTDKSPERAKDIVNSLPIAYNNLWNTYIKYSAEQMDSIISNKLRLIIRELIQNEQNIAPINRSQNNTNYYEKVKKNREQLNDKYDSLKKELFLTLRALNYILTNDKLYVLIPENLTDNKLNSKIKEYNSLIYRLKSILSKGRIYPIANIIEQKALQQRDEIISSLESQITTYIEDLTKQQKESKIGNTISAHLTKTDLQKASQLRRIKLLHKKYIYLKQKQEECNIAKDFKPDGVRIIREALPEAKIISPNISSAIFLTLLFGVILIPYSIYLTSSTINSKINSPKE